MGGSYFPNTQGATFTVRKVLSTYSIVKIYEKQSHMSKSKFMSDKRSQMSRLSVIIARNYASLCAEKEGH